MVRRHQNVYVNGDGPVRMHKELLPQMKLVNGAETESEQTTAKHPATILMMFGESLYLYIGASLQSSSHK